jgi:NAD(P)-dependent dehydrogenase (short-subunit alcohol dehydrogenase family)
LSEARTSIVTGGSGALGSAVVDLFLDAGDRVVVPWIVRSEADALSARRPAELERGRLVLVEADVAEDEGATAVAAAAGSAAVLVNGVGGFAGGEPVEATPLDVWDRLYRMNVRTAVAASRAVLPSMRARGRGVIVNVASQAALAPPGGIAAYAASKAAVVALTLSLQDEVAPAGLRVGAVVPTTIDTPANRKAMPDADFSKWTPPERIAAVVHWLASEAAATVRGALIPV